MSALIPAWVDGTLQPREKLLVHRKGWRHKAVSVFLNCGDATLLQRRALGKYHSGGLWANACCTHPAWGEDDLDCARRRLSEELNIDGVELTRTGALHYRADVGNGLIEDEDVTVFVGTLPSQIDVQPNPEEAMTVAWVSHSDLRVGIRNGPDRYTEWLKIYLGKHSDLLTA